jgi:nitrogen fixation/metabolism regulation signal transduction histidine kinase
LVEGSRSVGNGDFSARLDESIVKDEFKELYQAFNNYTERSEIELKELEKRANSNEKYLENVVVHLVDALIVIDELGTVIPPKNQGSFK